MIYGLEDVAKIGKDGYRRTTVNIGRFKQRGIT